MSPLFTISLSVILIERVESAVSSYVSTEYILSVILIEMIESAKLVHMLAQGIFYQSF